MAVTNELIETKYWSLAVPNIPYQDLMICIPTVHPIGDRRIIRCAQALLDIGYGIHFIWLGGEIGETLHHPRILETRLRTPKSFRDRIGAIPTIIKHAWKSKAKMWHIHDFYMLPFALAWKKCTKNPVLYDVHEYYPEYYARRKSIPKALQPKLEKLLTFLERKIAQKLSGVNTVSTALADRFRKAGIPTALTPNFPSTDPFRKAARPLTPTLLRRVIHTGNLNRSYGSEVIIKTAQELNRLAPDVEIIIIARFASESDRLSFAEALSKASPLPNLKIIDPIPAHKVPELLATCGIGISVVQDEGELPFSVNSKLYEYTAMGLAIVASDLPATRNFVNTHAVGLLAAPHSALEFAQAILDIINNAEKVCTIANLKASIALDDLSWEKTCAPRLQSLICKINS